MKAALILLAPSLACASITPMVGVSQFYKPADGVYWNASSPDENRMTPPAAGVRWDSNRHGDWSVGVQYTWFGRASMDAWAVTTDAPYPGGYIANSGGQCVGTCAPLAKWHMSSETQSIAFLATRHWGDFSLEAGMNVYEIRTKGSVDSYQGNPSGQFSYKETTWLDYGPVIGLAYQRGPWSLRLQAWRMEGKGDSADGYKAPSMYSPDRQYTLLAGYTL
ncbi:MAG: hypothetical protein KGL39_35975 [Patescibacteria group bacterium]|nr:hypothetical protein [Patescibacteria group bacterium]